MIASVNFIVSEFQNNYFIEIIKQIKDFERKDMQDAYLQSLI